MAQAGLTPELAMHQAGLPAAGSTAPPLNTQERVMRQAALQASWPANLVRRADAELGQLALPTLGHARK